MKKIKMTVDILMTAGLFLLMGYHLFGEAAHEWIGAGMLVLFVAHHILNRKWFMNLRKGSYHSFRKLMLVIDLLVLASMVMQMFSGIVMSRHVFTFLPFQGGMAMARRLHILGAYWGFILMSLHIGLHWNMVLGMVKKRTDASGAFGRRRILFHLSGMAVAVYGIYAFFKRNFITYLFLQSEFVFLDYEEPVWAFYLDYICLMGLWIFVIHSLSMGLRRTGSMKRTAVGKEQA